MTCRICSHSDLESFEIREMMWRTGEEFTYKKCRSCGCLQIESYPIEIEKYYSGKYYSYELGQSDFKRRFIQHLRHIRDCYETGMKDSILGAILSYIVPNYQIRSQFNFFKSHLMRFKGGNILDVGCGSDRFLKLFDSNFFSKRIGTDPFVKESYSCIDEHLEIQKKFFFEVTETYDVIFLNHSLEHMPNQSNIFSKISNSLNPGGIAVIRIPVIDSFAWDKYGVNWIQIDPPRHFYLHTIRSIDYLARESGLFVEDIGFDSSGFQFWGSEQNITGNVARISRSRHKEYQVMAQKLNAEKKGDQAIFILRHANE